MLMGFLTVFFTTFAFALLTLAYLWGYRFVMRNAPDQMVKFHFIMVAIRFLLAVTAVGIYTMFADNRGETMQFAALILVLYLAMIVITLIFKH